MPITKEELLTLRKLYESRLFVCAKYHQCIPYAELECYKEFEKSIKNFSGLSIMGSSQSMSISEWRSIQAWNCINAMISFKTYEKYLEDIYGRYGTFVKIKKEKENVEHYFAHHNDK